MHGGFFLIGKCVPNLFRRRKKLLGGWLNISVWVSGSFQRWRKIMTNLFVFQQSLRPSCLHQKKGAHVQKFEGVPCFWRFGSHLATKSFYFSRSVTSNSQQKNPYHPTNLTPPIVPTTLLLWAQGHQLRSGTGNGTPTFCLSPRLRGLADLVREIPLQDIMDPFL